MDISHILNNLNDMQRQAVTAPVGHQLILAGAGSGKTRVLVHRIAWLLQVENLFPSSILAVTFTNKAAHEMRSRVESLMNISTQGMWIGTFHSIAHRLLRMHCRDVGLEENFQVIDSDDQYRLIRRVLRNLNLDEDKWSPKQAQWFINSNKDESRRAQDVKPQGDLYLKTMQQIYLAYETACDQSSLVDFAELLLRAYELWQKNPDILNHFQQRFKHVLVDEFQDTNTIQYNWIKMLITPNNYLTVVGDDDQSIYGWRGARIENIHQLTSDFSAAHTIRLEQNYRSTGNILAAANALISKNTERMGKNLWTSGEKGDPIHVYEAFNELDEARYIVGIIRNWLKTGKSRADVGILYRSNAQSRVLEEAFIEAGIPYRIYGGLRFFERAEIKDALAYLRLIANKHDDTAFERIVNTPTRAIGNTTMTALREYARDKQISLWLTAEEHLNLDVLNSRAKNALNNFLDLITHLTHETETWELADITKFVLDTTNLVDHYRKEKGEKGRARIENLEELITATKQFQPEDKTIPILQAFLTHAALEAGESQANAFEDCVQMMTLHSAKGLEFPLVILSGMEEGLFPHQMSFEEPGRLAEERRLCYVGITRAMEKLYFTYAQSRRLHGSENYHRPSRFIREIPSEYLNEIRLKSEVSRPATITSVKRPMSAAELPGNMNIGSFVNHSKFGEGIILAYEGSGANARVHVKFSSAGSKWLIASYLNA